MPQPNFAASRGTRTDKEELGEGKAAPQSLIRGLVGLGFAFGNFSFLFGLGGAEGPPSFSPAPVFSQCGRCPAHWPKRGSKHLQHSS